MDESSKPHPGEGEEDGDGDGDEDEDKDKDKDKDGDKARAEELLEDCWYFGNLLHRNMSTNSYDDRPPKTKTCEETYESIKKLSRRNESGPSAAGLMRSPSLPPCPARKGSINYIVDPILAKGSDDDNIDQRRKSRLSETTSSDRVLEEDQEIIHDDEEQEEIEFSMGKLIRQASLKKTQPMLPTTHDLNKGMGRMSSGSGSTSPRKMEFSKLKLERLRPRRQMNQLKTQKSLSDLQSQELQGFKDLGFDLSKRSNLRPQEQLNPIDDHEGRRRRRRNTSHPAPDTAPAPTPAKWGSKEDDMKAQIKFWARAVASNMR